MIKASTAGSDDYACRIAADETITGTMAAQRALAASRIAYHIRLAAAALLA